jgi:hypothetical protein
MSRIPPPVPAEAFESGRQLLSKRVPCNKTIHNRQPPELLDPVEFHWIQNCCGKQNPSPPSGFRTIRRRNHASAGNAFRCYNENRAENCAFPLARGNGMPSIASCLDAIVVRAQSGLPPSSGGRNSL